MSKSMVQLFIVLIVVSATVAVLFGAVSPDRYIALLVMILVYLAPSPISLPDDKGR